MALSRRNTRKNTRKNRKNNVTMRRNNMMGGAGCRKDEGALMGGKRRRGRKGTRKSRKGRKGSRKH